MKHVCENDIIFEQQYSKTISNEIGDIYIYLVTTSIITPNRLLQLISRTINAKITPFNAHLIRNRYSNT
jgi:hypothetical protein